MRTTTSAAGPLAISAGTLRVPASIASSRPIALQNAASAIQVDGGFSYTALAGATVSGAGGLTKLGAGTLDLRRRASTTLGQPRSMPARSTSTHSLRLRQVTVASGAAMNVSAANLTLGSLANSGNVNFTNPAGTITVGSPHRQRDNELRRGASIPTLSSGTISVAGSATITTASGGTANFSGATASIGTLSNTAVNLAGGTALSISPARKPQAASPDRAV